MSRDRHDTPVLNYRAAEAAPRDDELSARERLLLRLVNQRVVMAPTLAGVLDALFDDAAPVLPCDRMGLAFVDDDGTTQPHVQGQHVLRARVLGQLVGGGLRERHAVLPQPVGHRAAVAQLEAPHRGPQRGLAIVARQRQRPAGSHHAAHQLLVVGVVAHALLGQRQQLGAARGQVVPAVTGHLVDAAQPLGAAARQRGQQRKDEQAEDAAGHGLTPWCGRRRACRGTPSTARPAAP